MTKNSRGFLMSIRKTDFEKYTFCYETKRKQSIKEYHHGVGYLG